MPLVVDTYNVLHVTGVLPPEMAGIDVKGLVRLIGASRYAREPAILVCDGSPGPDGPVDDVGAVQIRYAGAGRDTDAAIERLIARSTSPRRLTIVSSDSRIQRSARRRRCRTVDAETFLGHLAADAESRRDRPARAKPTQPLTPAQMEGWARYFGLSEADLAIPSAGAGERPLESAESLDDVDLEDLESFDMGEWMKDE